MILLDPGALAPRRDLHRTSAGDGFVDVLAALTALADTPPTPAAPDQLLAALGMDASTGGPDTDTADVIGAAHGDLTDGGVEGSPVLDTEARTGRRPGPFLADLTEHPGLQRRQLLALLATPAASGLAGSISGDVAVAATTPPLSATGPLDGELVSDLLLPAEPLAETVADELLEDEPLAVASSGPAGGSSPAPEVSDVVTEAAVAVRPDAAPPSGAARGVAPGDVTPPRGELAPSGGDLGPAVRTTARAGPSDAPSAAAERPPVSAPAARTGGEAGHAAADATFEPLRDVAPTARSESVRSTTAAFVERLVEAAARLENLPPPRQLTLELGEIRVRMALEDGALRIQVLGRGDAAGQDHLREDLERELRARGFDLGSDARERGRGADGEERPDPAWGPTRRAPRAADRGVPTRPSDLHL